MRSVNVAELKNSLSKYLRLVKAGQEVIIRERNRPIGRLAPLSSIDASEEELELVAAGKMRLPEQKLDVEEFLKLPTARVAGNKALEALIAEREED